MIADLKFWLSFFLIAGVIIFVGWSEPLRYRFMSRTQIELDIYGTPKPAPPEKKVAVATPQPNWMWDPKRKTPLDKESYNQNYSRTFTSDYYYRRPTPYPTQ